MYPLILKVLDIVQGIAAEIWQLKISHSQLGFSFWRTVQIDQYICSNHVICNTVS